MGSRIETGFLKFPVVHLMTEYFITLLFPSSGMIVIKRKQFIYFVFIPVFLFNYNLIYL